jgi:hypothetical protein
VAVNPGNGEQAAAEAPTRDWTPPPAPTRELTAVPGAASGDRCGICGSPLAHDQQYCVECGERRGQSTVPQAGTVTEVRSSRVRAAPPPRPPRVSSGTTLVSFVGVLLLAIGLGVLIGRIGTNNNTPKSGGPATQVISVSGAGGAPAATSATISTSATTPTHLTKKAQSRLNAAAKATAPPSAAVQKKAVQAAGKVLGNANNLAPPTVTQGGSCTSGQAGCQNNKFSGNFFGQ